MNLRIVISFIFFCSIDVFAALDLSLKDAIDSATTRNEDVKIKKISREKFDYQYKEARSLAYPKVKGEVDWYNYLKAPTINTSFPGVGDISFALKQPYEISMGATLTQPVWTFGKVSTAIDIANSARDAEDLSLLSTKRDVGYQAKILYFNVLFAKQLVDIAQRSYQNAIKNKGALEAKFKFGRTSRYDNVKMSADIAVRKPTVIEAETSLFVALKNLKMHIGIADDTELNLTDKLGENFTEYDVAKQRENMQNFEPTMKALQKSSELYRSLSKLKKADFYPSIAAMASYQYTGNSNRAFVGADNMYHVFMVGLVFTVNLWDSGETYSKYMQALKDYDVSDLNLIKVKKAYNLQLESSIAEFNSLLKTYQANKAALDLSERSYNISLSSFTSGQITQSQLNDAELMLTQSKISMQQTVFKLNILLAGIEKLSAEDSK